MTETRYGYPLTDWTKARDQIDGILRECARGRTLITYTDLTARITAIQIAPHDYALAELLGEVSAEDHAHGRGMRSALVVAKADASPGTGFFALARQLGGKVDDELSYWVEQLNKVYKDWA